MTAPPSLGDRVALAILEHGPMPCERLARLVEARTSEVRDALRDDPRFEHAGAGRGSRWRLVLSAWDGKGRDSPAGSSSDDGLDVAARLRALERRVAELELQRRPAE